MDTTAPAVVNKDAGQDKLVIATGIHAGVWRRARTIIVEEWVGVTKAAAEAYVDTHAGDTDKRHQMIETNRVLGAAKVVRITDSKAAYVKDT